MAGVGGTVVLGSTVAVGVLSGSDQLWQLQLDNSCENTAN